MRYPARVPKVFTEQLAIIFTAQTSPDSVSALIWYGGLVAALIAGVGLWALGRRLARPACTVSGFVLGGLGTMVLSRELAGEGYIIPLIILGAIAGCLLAFLMFKVWMALSGALFLALAIPVAHIVWEGVPVPPTPPPTAWLSDQHPGPPSGSDIHESLTGLYESQREYVAEWWRQLEPTTQRTLLIAGAVGAALGFAVGLIYPYQVASLESGFVGTLLVFCATRSLLMAYAPAMNRWLPDSPRAGLVLVSLITLLGAIGQWTFLRPRTDS